MPVDRAQLQAQLAVLAQASVFLGTSSWKYPGWRGQLYDEARYVWRGRWSESRFEKLCLADYAEVFSTVCVDAAYYKFPEGRYLEDLAGLVPPHFQFTLKVTDAITLKRFANLPRFGLRGGQTNPDFLNADLFQRAFLSACEPCRSRIGLLIFEFSKFYPADFERGRDFMEALDGFLAQLPTGWRYGIEIRNRHFLKPEYFATLAKHGVAHIYNSWQDMPSLKEQLAIGESRTTPDFFGARLLLKPGRKYEEAVKAFSPYNEIKDPYPEGREAGAALIRQARLSQGKTRAYIYVNNRFEGNALETIAAIIERARNSLT
jgi:uncharacterized protein YecE (DUF72 family)